MKDGLIKLTAFIVGALLALMTIFNTLLGTRTSQEVSLIINQVTGLLLLLLIMAAGRNNSFIRPKKGKLPWYLHFGGLFGIVLMLFNNLAVLGCGATVAMAATVFGQCLTGLVFDCTGFMGMRRRPLTARKALSLLVSFLGILVMILFSKEAFSPLYVLLAMMGGVLFMTQTVHNSFVAGYKGAFFSSTLNNAGGLIGILLLSFLTRPEATAGAFKALGSVSPLLIIAGGSIGILITVTCNTIIPKIPGAVSSLLISAGQILAGIPLDYLLFHRFTPALLSGALIMVLGLLIDKEDG